MNSYGLSKVQIRGLDAIYESELKALPWKPTTLVKDHRKSNNIYLSRYGETSVERLNNYSYISIFCSIGDLVRFVVREGEKIKGSVHEDYFYSVRCIATHDSKGNDKKNVKNKYLHQLLLPFNGLKYGITYSRRPIVNRTEFTPFNNSLNRDILHYFNFCE